MCNADVFKKVQPPALSAEARSLSSKWPRRVGIVVRETSIDLNTESWNLFGSFMPCCFVLLDKFLNYSRFIYFSMTFEY